MKSYIIILLILISGLTSYCQNKNAIDTSDFKNWPKQYDRPVFSNDCKYVFVLVEYPNLSGSKIMVRSTNGLWKKDIYSQIHLNVGTTIVFTADSKNLLFFNSRNNVEILSLESNTTEIIPQVKEFRASKKGDGKWIGYTTNENKVVICNLKTAQKEVLPAGSNYMFSNDGGFLLLQSRNDSNLVTFYQVRLKDLNKDKEKIIWQGIGTPSNYVFSHDVSKIAFSTTEKQKSLQVHSLWIYDQTIDSTYYVSNDNALDSCTAISVTGKMNFSKNDSKLYFKLVAKNNGKASGLRIWSYKDPELISKQLPNAALKQYTAVIDLSSKKLIRLEYENEKIRAIAVDGGIENNEYVLTVYRSGDPDEFNWSKNARASYSIVSLSNGSRQKIISNMVLKNTGNVSISPNEKYVIYFDNKTQNYFSYVIKSHRTYNLTNLIHVRWTHNSERIEDRYSPIAGSSGGFDWLDGDKAFFAYDTYDIWRIDPTSIIAPVNLTRYCGKRHDIIFRILKASKNDENIVNDSTVYLSAFCSHNKNSGFYKLKLKQALPPEKLSMGPYSYSYGDPVFTLSGSLTKSLDSNIYVGFRMNSTEYPNYFITSDFRNYSFITDFHPEKKYNWIRAQLMYWKLPDGGICSGILYRPENFNAKKKYPVLFNYYDKMSNLLNQYPFPGPVEANINIPYFVSRGYLIFTPDIHYKIGLTGENALNSLVSAAKYLSSFSWVDPRKMGLQGHSFGGYETNYIVTHTNIFSAACSVSGISDLIGGVYGSLTRPGAFFMDWAETGQENIGATLWRRPDLYIKNSPIYKANNLHTPLLIVGNKKDDNVSYVQSLEFFTALRRLGKRTWMLQYDNGVHSLFGEDAKDFTIRLEQFFDYYLKGGSPPAWMRGE